MKSSVPSALAALNLDDLIEIDEGSFDTSRLDLPRARAIVRHKLVGEVAALLPRQSPLSPAQNLILSAGKASRLRMLRVAAATALASSVLTKAGIRVLAIKGPALSWLTTGHWGQRASVDVDLLIDPRDISRAHLAVTQAGLARWDGRTEPPGVIEQWCHCEMAYSGLQATIDLHWRMDACPALCRIPFDALWQESIPFEINDRIVRTPSARHALILSVIHGTRSEWAQWAMLLDVIRLARLVDIRSDSIADLARVAGVGRAFAAIADVLSALCATDPDRVTRSLADARLRTLLAHSATGLRASSNATAGVHRRWRQAWSSGNPVVAIDSLGRALMRHGLSIARRNHNMHSTKFKQT